MVGAVSSVPRDRGGRLTSLVDRSAARASARVLWVMMARFRLPDHLEALRKFVLLGQGDFVAALMSGLGSHLDLPHAEQSPHTLLTVLESAVRSSNAQFARAEVLDRLSVKLLAPSPGDVGWDTFTLDYAVTPPLTAVLTPQALATYRRVFVFLWRLKRVEWALNNTWRRHVAATHSPALRAQPSFASVLHRCHLLRNDMISFVSSLSSFILIEVLETSWRQLQHDLRHARDLPGVIRAHRRYLRSIVDRALLSRRRVEHRVAATLRSLLDDALRFARTQDALVSEALALASRLPVPTRSATRREATEGGRRGASAAKDRRERERGRGRGAAPTAATAPTASSSAAAGDSKDAEDAESAADALDAAVAKSELGAIVARFTAEVDEVAVAYRRRMLVLLAALEAEGADLEEFRFLMFRFDFNEFYDILAARAAAAGGGSAAVAVLAAATGASLARRGGGTAGAGTPGPATRWMSARDEEEELLRAWDAGSVDGDRRASLGSR